MTKTRDLGRSDDLHAAAWQLSRGGVASILELPIEKVPSVYATEDRVACSGRQIRWLRSMGLRLVWVHDGQPSWSDVAEGWRPDGYWIATNDVGPFGHCTVWRRDRS